MRLAVHVMPLLPRRLRHHVIRSQIRLDEQVMNEVVLKVADTADEVLAAARLVHDSYVGRGLMPPHPAGVRIVPHQALPETITFVAKHHDEVIGTISLVVDAKMGLPMEKIYGDEVAALRAEGKRVAEAGAQCIKPEYRHTGVSFLLSKLMITTAREALGVDDLLIAVHPNAAELYEATLLFVRTGPVRCYPGLNEKALAVMLRLDLAHMKADFQKEWGHLPKDTRNPLYMYIERSDPQLQIPLDNAFVWDRWPMRLQAVAELFALCPEALKGLPKPRFDDLRAMIAARNVVVTTFSEGPPRNGATSKGRPPVALPAEGSFFTPWLTTRDWVMANA